MNEKRVAEKLEHALASFFAKDVKLLESDVREDALAHRLAMHIADDFEELDVDAEYDKMHVDGLPSPKKYIGSDGRERHAIPDIIVHRRQTMENFIAIEIKKLGHDAGRGKDFTKLRAYKDQLGYKFAVFIELGLEQRRPVWNLQFMKDDDEGAD